MRSRSGTLPKELSASILPPWARTALPGRAKSAVRRAICRSIDVADRIAGRTDRMLPPCRLRVRVGCFLSFVRVSRFRAVAEEFLAHLRALAALHPGTRVLDIGCGCGQIAVPLTRVLGRDGSYDGFDPDREAIDWCATHITSEHANFRFTHADIRNPQYNPDGAMDAAAFRLPYSDASFDVIVLKSVFTHLQAPAMEHYMSEIRRMLRPGGRVVASFFLLNDDANKHIEGGESDLQFPFTGDGCRLVDPGTPEYLLAYEESSVRKVALAQGLAVASIEYGSWCGRPRFLSYQDLVVLSHADVGSRVA